MRTPTSSGSEHGGEPTHEGEVNRDADITPPTPARSRIAAGTTPPRRRHTVDEVIESGEIVERRSLVIRSKTVPSIDLDDEVTEITSIPRPMPQTRSRRMLWLFAGIACGAVAVTLMLLTRPRAAALESRAEMIGTMLDGEARAARVRVEAIASSPVLRAGIETDGRTLADMIHDNDLVLPLQRGDVIEMFQVRDGTRTLVLRLPAGATGLGPPPTDGTRIDAKNHGVVVVAKAAIPKRTSGVAGEIVLSTPVDLTAVSMSVSERTSGAVLDGLGETIVLVEGGTPNVRIPITTKSPVAGSLSLAAVVPPNASRAFAWGLMAASLLALSMFAASVFRGRRRGQLALPPRLHDRRS